MKFKNISLITLLKEVINEVGDLENIHPYDYNLNNDGGEFDIILHDIKTKVKVNITKSPDKLKPEFNFPPIISSNDKEVYNVGFTVGNEDTQYSKEDYSILVKTIKTVVEIVKNSLNKYPKNIIFVFFAASKIGKGHQDPQKLKFYKIILQQNLPNGWRIGTSEFIGNEFIFITPIKINK